MNNTAIWAKTQHNRVLQLALPWSRETCACGCDTRATHVGVAGTIMLAIGCELSVRRWVRDGERATIKRDETSR